MDGEQNAEQSDQTHPKTVNRGDVHYQTVVINSVLVYVANSMSNSAADTIKKCCSDFYTYEELIAAKNLLWDVGDSKVLPTKKNRREGTTRPVIEAVIDDIVDGMTHLDARDIVPPFGVDILGLNRIPKVIPAETLSLSICERLVSLENRIRNTEDVLSNNVAKTMNLEEKISISTSYAAQVSKSVPVSSSDCTVAPRSGASAVPSTSAPHSLTIPVPARPAPARKSLPSRVHPG